MIDDYGLERFDNQEGIRAGVPLDRQSIDEVANEVDKIIEQRQRSYAAHMKKLAAIGYNYSGLPTRRSINRE